MIVVRAICHFVSLVMARSDYDVQESIRATGYAMQATRDRLEVSGMLRGS